MINLGRGFAATARLPRWTGRPLRVGQQSAARSSPTCMPAAESSRPVTDCDLRARLSRQGSCSRAICRWISGGGSRIATRLAEPLGVDVRTRPPPSSTSSTTPWRNAQGRLRPAPATMRASSCSAAFGGAGPLHAAALGGPARIAEVLCRPSGASPRSASSAAIRRDYVRTVYTTTATAIPRAGAASPRSRRKAVACSIALQSRGAAAVRALRRCALRRQSCELPVPVPGVC